MWDAPGRPNDQRCVHIEIGTIEAVNDLATMDFRYGSLALTIEENKENIPPGLHKAQIGSEQVVLPLLPPGGSASPRVVVQRDDVGDDVDVVGDSPIPRPSPSLSQSSETSAFSSQDSLTDSPLIIQASIDDSEDDPECTSRKEKSLGLLCQRFLVSMNEETRDKPNGEVHLETVARKMNVEKRRIYDIVNVMEALDAMQKTNKSYYKWYGLDQLPKLMADLQKEALVEKLPERVLRVEQAMCSFIELSAQRRNSARGDVVGCLTSGASTSVEDRSAVVQMSSLSVQDIRRSRVDNRDRQGRNSLAQLCRRFLMVLLSNPGKIRKVSLDVASTVLIKDPDTEGFEPPSRSRCRRLYDIANVLVALGLIKKVHYLFGTKKIPLFVYCGPEPDENGTFDANACVEKLLLNPASAPQTPHMKATTAALAHQLTMGKRSRSEAAINLKTSQLKMPRINSEDLMSSSSLMMFAEFAAAEQMRLETLARMTQQFAIASSMPSTSSTPSIALSMPALPQAGKVIKPEPQRVGSYSASPNSPLADKDNKYTVRMGNTYSTIGAMPSILLPPNPTRGVFEPLRPAVLQAPPPAAPTAPAQRENACKYSMSQILAPRQGAMLLDHKHNSPFQPVKKDGQQREKRPFGELQNRM